MDYILEVLEDRSILSIPVFKNKLFDEFEKIAKDEEIGFFLRHRVADFLEEYNKADDENKFSLLNKLLNWIYEGYVQQRMSDQIIDYTKMKPGEYCERGFIVSICPECGRPGHVQDDEPDCFHVTTHIEKIMGAIMSQSLDGCHLRTGMPWEDPGNHTYNALDLE